MLRSFVFLAAICCLPLCASAQQPAPQQAPAPPAVSCSDVKLGAATSADIGFVRSCLDAERQQEEIQSLRQPRDVLENMNPAVATVLAAIIGLIAAGIGYLFKHLAERSIMKTKFEYERADRYESRLGELLDQLSEPSDARRMFAVEGLIQLSGELSRNKPPKRAQPLDAAVPLKILISTLRSSDRSEAITKFTADELAKLFKPGQSKFHMKDFNFQSVNLTKAWWAGIDASEADLFESNLKGASLRDATLVNTVLYGANLEGTVFKGANLKGANLSGALNIDKASFDARTQWSAKTQWPQGFDPAARGLPPASA